MLALVMRSFERRERQWLFLALLSFVTAVDTFCDLAGNAGLKGSAGFGTSLFDAVQLILVPWPMYLLIMTLGTLQGRVGERRKRWYTISFITASTVCLIFALGIFYYRLHFSKAGGGVNFTLNDPEIPGHCGDLPRPVAGRGDDLVHYRSGPSGAQIVAHQKATPVGSVPVPWPPASLRFS
ncbi:MAG: hypothetical protein IPH00_10590 [Flavobacteriales bacterium]|nr:hypothetical protein [Flavobacteriales bacterium]